MIHTLADLQPIILITLLITMYSIESFIPYLPKPGNKKQHDLHNLFLTLLSFVVNGLVGLAVVFVVVYTKDHQLGLFNQLELPQYSETIICILLIDFGSYGFHNLMHRVPFLWRLHRVHHSDLNLNTTSSLRFHPFEVVLSQGLYFCIAILVFGISMPAFIIYGTLGLIFVVIQHSNVKFPDAIEKYGRYIFSTPGWHKIHHSKDKKYTDSHFGDVFTFWDRIFGTWHKINPDEIKYGLKEFEDPNRQKAGYLLRVPFIDVTKGDSGKSN